MSRTQEEMDLEDERKGTEALRWKGERFGLSEADRATQKSPAIEDRHVRQEREIYSIEDFCAAYSLSRSMLYKMWRQGIGPRYFKIGKRVLMTVKAVEAWQREREQQNGIT